MISDEKGYIQFECVWDRVEAIDHPRIAELARWRKILRSQGLLGVDDQGVGFGNISERVTGDDAFLITATQTGHHADLDSRHIALVSEADVSRNRIRCSGAIRASSESLSHAILYDLDDAIGAVVHVHDAISWNRLMHRAPTTDRTAQAGTVAMAAAIGKLFEESELRRVKILVMGGHQNGLISFGGDIAEASAIMLAACGRPIPDGVNVPESVQFA